MDKTDDQLKEYIEINESRAEQSAWFVFFGLVIQIVLSLLIALGVSKKWEENWGTFAYNCLVISGAFCQIHFTRKALRANSELRQRSEERVAEANKIAAQANARTAEAELRLAALQRQIEFRQIADEPKFLSSLQIEHEHTLAVLIDFSSDAQDGFLLASQIERLLRQAKWNVSGMRRLHRDDPIFDAQLAVQTGGPPAKIAMLINSHGNNPPDGEPTRKLWWALMDELGIISLQSYPTVNRGEIRLVIFPKL